MSNSKILDAFPSFLRQEVAIVLDFLKDKRFEIYTNQQQKIVIMGKVIIIPYRIKADWLEGENLSKVQQNIVHCLYLRHHDGFIRQKSLEKLLSQTDLFIVPFVFQLLGEYVIEIVVLVSQHINDIFTGFSICTSNDYFKVLNQIPQTWEQELRQKLVVDLVFFQELSKHTDDDVCDFAQCIVDNLSK